VFSFEYYQTFVAVKLGCVLADAFVDYAIQFNQHLLLWKMTTPTGIR